jgi:YfiR/HmsC-like
LSYSELCLAFSLELGGNGGKRFAKTRLAAAIATQRFMRVRATLFLGLGLLGLLLVSGEGRTQEAQPGEYQIKAAFLFNFARFVEWPAKAFSATNSPMIIGVLGENPFHDDLAHTIQNKTVDEHSIQVKQFSSLTEATNCQILFISTSEKSRLPKIISGLKGTSVLTVGEMDQFIESGGMINFVIQGSKVRFQINNDAATGASLKISSKLLALAVHP